MNQVLVERQLTVTIALVYYGDIDGKLWRLDMLALGRFLAAPRWQTAAEIVEVEGG